MKKLSTIIIAMALMLGMGQCKKQETPTTDDTEGGKVYITVNVGDNGAKHDIYPGTGAYVFTNGDKLYVGNNGQYIGTLTYNNGAFSGTITGPSTEDYLHFYFVGGLATTPAELTAGTTSYTVSIANQSSKLPILSYGPSTQKYTDASGVYSTILKNQCALVKFVPSTATSNEVTLTGMKNEVSLDFANNTLQPTGTTGNIKLKSMSNTEKWAILLPQDAAPGTAVNIQDYVSTTDIPAITNNMYHNSGIGINMEAVVTVTTQTVYELGTSKAVAGGNVATQATITERGFCWGAAENPTTDDSRIAVGSGTGKFVANLTGLSEGTYHVRAYAISTSLLTGDPVTNYGSDLTFTTCIVPGGAASGVFTVANNKKVRFANGNLQHQGSSSTWRLAENPWVSMGNTAGNTATSSTQTAWTDLFYWAYYDSHEHANRGSNTYMEPPKNFSEFNGTLDNANNTVGWKTLSSNDWNMVIGSRNGSTINGVANARFLKASVNEVHGVILFPDLFVWPDDLSLPSAINTPNNGYNGGIYTSEEWQKLASNGAVFLPVTGTVHYNQGSVTFDHGDEGWYHSCSRSWTYSVYFLNFYQSEVHTYYFNDYYRGAVRLAYEYN